jgi:enoyl-CoA hydratase
VPKPTVAAITGYALGGGMEVALGCDRRVCGDNVKLGQPEILLGIIPGGGGTQRMSRLIGPSRTKDLIFTGRMVDAQEALAIGLVDEVVAADEVHATARRWAEKFANGPAIALAAAKKAIDGGLDVDLRTGLDIESELFAALFATDDRAAGMESFVENGPGKAQFTGR